MLTKFANRIKARIKSSPLLYGLLARVGKPVYRKLVPTYPHMSPGEIGAVVKVLKSTQWNMTYGKNLVHEELEQRFAEFIGTKYAVAVNTGGMAIQMSLRALGLKPGDEVVHQVDTCVADSFAVLNSGATPIFADISLQSFMLQREDLEQWIGPNTKVIMPVHIWGNPEDMDMVMGIARQRNLLILEDAALSFGAEWKGRKVGSIGTLGVFSFGSSKPIQAGEGGMITTNDEGLARELKTMRHWGDRTFEFGTRGQKVLSWNGRMSEIVAAVALQQVNAYPAHLDIIRSNVAHFQEQVNNIEGIQMAFKPQIGSKPAFSQVVLRLDETILGISKDQFARRLQEQGVAVWHANFEPISSLDFFRQGFWKDWIFKGDLARVHQNYSRKYPIAEIVYEKFGLGLQKSNFLSSSTTNFTLGALKKVLN